MKYSFFVLLFISVFNLFAQENGLAFLNIPTNVKDVGMGNVTAISHQSAASLFSNPAALANASTFNLYTAGRFGFLDSNFGVGAFVWRTKEYGSFGIGFLSLGVDKIERRDNLNHLTGLMSSAQSAFYLSYAKSFLSAYSVGINVKYISLSLDMIEENARADGYGVELGLMYNFNKNWKLGAFLQDNMAVKWDASNINESPITIKIGAEYQSEMMKELSVKMDFVQRQKLPIYLNAGLEYSLFINNVLENISLRMGVSNIYIESRNLSISTGELNKNNFAFSTGFGLKTTVGDYGMTFDYAFRTHAYLDNIHFTGITLDF